MQLTNDVCLAPRVLLQSSPPQELQHASPGHPCCAADNAQVLKPCVGPCSIQSPRHSVRKRPRALQQMQRVQLRAGPEHYIHACADAVQRFQCSADRAAFHAVLTHVRWCTAGHHATDHAEQLPYSRRWSTHGAAQPVHCTQMAIVTALLSKTTPSSVTVLKCSRNARRWGHAAAKQVSSQSDTSAPTLVESSVRNSLADARDCSAAPPKPHPTLRLCSDGSWPVASCARRPLCRMASAPAEAVHAQFLCMYMRKKAADMSHPLPITVKRQRHDACDMHVSAIHAFLDLEEENYAHLVASQTARPATAGPSKT